jgi:rare lipoprotein A (peptidoglycan hydrolase)
MQATATCVLSGLAFALALGASAAQATESAPAHATTIVDSGQATWYGPRHEGRRTTSGEVFDSHKLTAAHASLPLGSYVRVTVRDTGRSVVVKVNDREPPHGIRCIDLSRAAASRLGIVNRGVADVTIETAGRADAAEELAEAPDGAVPVEGARPRALRARHRSAHRRQAHG